MIFSFADYATWTHETAVRRVEGRTDDRERAELMEIWGLGVGGEFLEMLASMEEWPASWASPIQIRPGRDTWEEAGDVIYYLARLYVDTGNHDRLRDVRYAADCFSPREWSEDPMRLPELAKHVGRVVETIKKALRKHGRPGLVALGKHPDDACGFDVGGGSVCMRRDHHEHETIKRMEDGVVIRGVTTWLPGRREEFGGILDLALAALTSWFERHGTTLEAVCEVNRKKLEARRAAGTIAVQGSREGAK